LIHVKLVGLPERLGVEAPPRRDCPNASALKLLLQGYLGASALGAWQKVGMPERFGVEAPQEGLPERLGVEAPP